MILIVKDFRCSCSFYGFPILWISRSYINVLIVPLKSLAEYLLTSHLFNGCYHIAFQGLFRNFGDTFLPMFVGHLERLVKETQKSSQRCAAEIITGESHLQMVNKQLINQYQILGILAHQYLLLIKCLFSCIKLLLYTICFDICYRCTQPPYGN